VDIQATLTALYSAIQGRQWALVGVLAVVALVYAARTWGGTLLPWLRSDRGGAALALLAGIFGALATALLSGTALTPLVVLDGVVLGIGAAGGYSVVRKLLGITSAA
jgi:hypothetical protein